MTERGDATKSKEESSLDADALAGCLSSHSQSIVDDEEITEINKMIQAYDDQASDNEEAKEVDVF